MAAFKIPKQLAVCADLLYETRQKRLDMQKVVDELASQESQLRNHIIDNLPKSNALGITGKVARVTVVNKDVVQVADWEALYGYILKTAKKDPGVWSLLQKRVGEATVKDLWAADVKVPGVAKLQVPTISLNKV